MKRIWETTSKFLAVTGIAVLMYSASAPQRAEAGAGLTLTPCHPGPAICVQGKCYSFTKSCQQLIAVDPNTGELVCCR